MSENIEENFILYCCTIGLIGNALVCILLLRIISSKKFKKSNQTKHNYVIYMYFVGICVSDMIVLANWFISKVNIEAKLGVQISFGDHDSHSDNIFINNDDFFKFFNNISSMNSSNRKFYKKNYDYDINISYAIGTLTAETETLKEYMSIKLTNIQGICQLYNYFAIATLCASLSFTLAALFDRYFKIDVVYNVYILGKSKSKATDSLNKSINRKQSDEFDDNALEPQMNLKLNHSELVRQLFGKSSVVFIFVVVAFFHFHLLWIFGSLPSYIDQTRIKSPAIAYKTGLHEYEGYFSIVKSKPDCTLLLTNLLPYFVFVLDLVILLIFSLLQIVLCFLIMKIVMKKEKLVRLNQLKVIQVSEKIEKNKNRYLIVNPIISVSVFSFLFNIPSLISRIILMIVFAYFHSNANETGVNQLEKSNHLNETFFSNGSDVNMMNDSSAQSSDYFSMLNSICNKLDILLVASSSHKFLIFIWQFRLIKVPFWLKKIF